MLMMTITDKLEHWLGPYRESSGQDLSYALSYFFCQGTDSSLNNATAVLRGLLYLLCDQYPSMLSHLRESYDKAGQKLFEGTTAFFLLSEVFEEMLKDRNLTKVYFAVDALDECMVDRKQLLELIVDFAAKFPRAKWIVSSRNTNDIEQHLKADRFNRQLDLEATQNAQKLSRAVHDYIGHKTLELISLREDDKTREHAREIMCSKANGTFLRAALVIQELGKVKVIKRPKQRRDKVLDDIGKIPGTLEGLYDRMLEQIELMEWDETGRCELILSDGWR